MTNPMHDDGDSNVPPAYPRHRLRRPLERSVSRRYSSTEALTEEASVNDLPLWLRQAQPSSDQVAVRHGSQPGMAEDEVARALQSAPDTRDDDGPDRLDELGLAPRPSRWVKFGVAVLAAAVVALLIAVFLPELKSASPTGSDQVVAAAAKAAPEASVAKPKPLPSFKVTDGSGPVNEALPLGIRVSGVEPGAGVTLTGLPPGTQLSRGQAARAGEWRVPVQDLDATAVIPPRDFAGDILIGSELRSPAGEALVASSVRLTWTAPVKPAPEARPAAPPAEPAVRKIDPQEIATLLGRAQALIAAGDLQPARLLLLRAAEARHGPAAFALAETYDPVVLKRYGVQAPSADLKLAREWYAKAREFGVAEAQARLDAMNAVSR